MSHTSLNMTSSDPSGAPGDRGGLEHWCNVKEVTVVFIVTEGRFITSGQYFLFLGEIILRGGVWERWIGQGIYEVHRGLYFDCTIYTICTVLGTFRLTSGESSLEYLIIRNEREYPFKLQPIYIYNCIAELGDDSFSIEVSQR